MARREHDAYYTPNGAVMELIKRRPDIGQAGDVVVEPCVGGGAVADPFRARGCVVLTNDVVPSIAADMNDDACASHTWRGLELLGAERGARKFDGCRGIDWTISNPPFVAAMPILQQAYVRSRLGVAFFLRLSFLEPTEDRGAWLAAHPPDELIALPRISFTGDGNTDSVICAWMIWYATEGMRSRASRNRPIEIVQELGDAEAEDDAQASLWGV